MLYEVITTWSAPAWCRRCSPTATARCWSPRRRSSGVGRTALALLALLAAVSAQASSLERFERYLRINTNLGASISLVPLLKQYWKINHYGDPKS